MDFIKYITGLLVFFLAVVLLSCEKNVILDLSDTEGKYLIVEANIDDSGVRQEVRLRHSTSFYDSGKWFPASDAVVLITDGKKNYYFTQKNSHKERYYNYELSSSLVTGNKYYLTVHDAGGTYTASSTIKPVPEIDSVTTRVNLLSRLGIINEELIDIYIHFENLPDRGNFYLINLYVNDDIQTYTPSQKTVINDTHLKGYTSMYIRPIRRSDLSRGDKITLKMRSISREQYNFYNDFFSQSELSGNPFAGAPPANIPTNLSEGARGFFQVSSVSSASKIHIP